MESLLHTVAQVSPTLSIFTGSWSGSLRESYKSQSGLAVELAGEQARFTDQQRIAVWHVAPMLLGPLSLKSTIWERGLPDLKSKVILLG